MTVVSAGKEGLEFMEKVVYSSLGRVSPRMMVGPGRGLDNAVIALGHGRVLVVTVDPISAIPALGMPLSAWLSVHLIASDLAASGADPEFATFSYNFPPTLGPSEREEYLRSVSAECDRLGVAVAGGNTGSYPGGGFTVIGAGTMFGLASEDGYVTPAMARAGDAILVTKHAAIEATASLALSFPAYVTKKVGEATAKRARGSVRLCSTVEDARTTRKVGLGEGGITSMHDATEGGVLGALDEMSFASRKTFEVDVASIPVSNEAAMVCASFGIDPLRTMGEGALLVTCRRDRVPELERKMSRGSIPVHEIGVVKEGVGLHLKRRGRRAIRFKPAPDRYWVAYEKATLSKLS